MEIKIVKASYKHIPHLAKNIRKEDVQELYDYAMLLPTQALLQSLHNSKKAWTGTVDDVPVCMFGVVDSLKDVGCVWLIGTDDIHIYAKRFLSLNKRMIPVMMNGYKRLENYVGAGNKRSIDWLVWLGFTFGKPEPKGPFNKMFIPFWMEKK